MQQHKCTLVIDEFVDVSINIVNNTFLKENGYLCFVVANTFQFQYRTLSIDHHYIRQPREWKRLQHGSHVKIKSF